MIIFLVISIIALLFILLFKENNIGLKMAMTVIFVFLSLRYNYGNDYRGYAEMFFDINSNFDDLINNSSRIEIGWILLNRLFNPLGFYSMIIFLAAFNCIVLYKFIVRFVSDKYYCLAIFLYLFDSNHMLVQLSAMRQTLAIILFILALGYIVDAKYIKALFLLLSCSLFHTSSLLLLPLIIILLIGKFNMKLIYIYIIEALFIVLFVFGELLKPNFGILVSVLFNEQYTTYLDFDMDSKASVVNMVIYSALIFVLLFYYNDLSGEYKIFTKLLVLGFFFMPIGFIIPVSSRLALYLFPISIIVYPKYLEIINSLIVKSIFSTGIVFVIIVRLITFFSSETYGPYYHEYSTIFGLLNY